MASSDEPAASAQTMETLEQALFEIRRVIAGQEQMLERVLVCLLTGGHLLIEGVPGLAKTLTVKTTAGVLGGTFNRIQFTPDLVPSDLVGTRDLSRGQRELRHRARARLLQLPARRRDQPRSGQGPVGAARGDAGAPGDDRPHDASRPRAVPRDGDAEPDRVRGDLPVAGGADRPLHAQDPRRLSAPRRGADGDPALARRAARADAAAVDRRPAADPGDRRAGSTSIPASSATRSQLATATRDARATRAARPGAVHLPSVRAHAGRSA